MQTKIQEPSSSCGWALVDLLVRDMALTHDEVVGLRDGLLTSGEPPTSKTRLSDWLAENGDCWIALDIEWWIAWPVASGGFLLFTCQYGRWLERRKQEIEKGDALAKSREITRQVRKECKRKSYRRQERPR